MSLTEDAVLSVLRTVQDPELFKDIVTLNMVKKIRVCEGNVSLDIELTTPACPLKDKIRADIVAAVSKLPGVENVLVNFSAQVRQAPVPTGAPAAAGAEKPLIPGVKNIIAVGAGKGGVGKSMVAVNLAVGLAMQGAKVGLLDADVYGPSIPTMFGIGPQAPALRGDTIIPFELGPGENTLKVMSIGFIVEKEKALIWRGPMVHGAIRQFLGQVDWGQLDYLIIDLPPGTGDVVLTLAQTVPLTGAVVVATPQEVALADARRAVRMFQQLGVDVLGVVENMSYFVCEHGSQYDIFGRGGARAMAEKMNLHFLGEVPIDTRIRINSDQGDPFANFGKDSISRSYLEAMVQQLAARVSVRNAGQTAGKTVSLKIT